MTRNTEVDFISRIQHPDFRALGRSLPFVGFSLAEISDRGCLLPDGIVESSVHPGRAFDSNSLDNSLRQLCVGRCRSSAFCPSIA